MKGNRRLFAVLLLGLVGIATFNWFIAINVVFAVLVYDWLLEEETKEYERIESDYFLEIEKEEWQYAKDKRFKRIMNDNKTIKGK